MTTYADVSKVKVTVNELKNVRKSHQDPTGINENAACRDSKEK